MEPTELVGMPKVEGGMTHYYPPAFLPIQGRGLFVFEELNRCPNYMRAPTLQLLTERSLNDYRLPRGWLPAAAINPADGGYEVFDLDAALLSRFVQVAVDPDQAEWLSWARANRVHFAVVEYVASDAQIFLAAESNPRAWTYVSDILCAEAKVRPSGDVLRAAVVGLVGEQRGAAFLSFLSKRVRPLTSDEVLSAYARHRPILREWVSSGRLDLVRGSMLAVLKHLQARPNYDGAKGSRACWKRLGAFMHDLPGDLREEAGRFFDERGYSRPSVQRSLA
jgi:hypothetical protein